MNENAEKTQRKFEEVLRLVKEFGSQSEQLQASKVQLEKTVKIIEEKLEKIVRSLDEGIRIQKQGGGRSSKVV